MNNHGIADTITGWVLLTGSVSLNWVKQHFHPVMCVDYVVVDHLITQLLHLIQIGGIMAGVYFTWKGKRRPNNDEEID